MFLLFTGSPIFLFLIFLHPNYHWVLDLLVRLHPADPPIMDRYGVLISDTGSPLSADSYPFSFPFSLLIDFTSPLSTNI